MIAVNLRRLLVLGLLAGTLVLFAMGSLAAVAGGGLSDWGKGAGGLGGWADLSITFFSLGVGSAAGIATFREGRSKAVSVAVFATGLLVGVGFLMGGHLLDPCARGWLDFGDRLGDALLCNSRSIAPFSAPSTASGGDIATRFHLLLHATTGVVSASVAVFIYRRKNLLGGERVATLESAT